MSTVFPDRLNDEIVLEVRMGAVLRERMRDLRSVPDQTGEELARSLPSFLLKAQPD